MKYIIYIVSFAFAFVIYQKYKTSIYHYISIPKREKLLYSSFIVMLISSFNFDISFYNIQRTIAIVIVSISLLKYYSKKGIRPKGNLVSCFLLLFFLICVLSTIYSVSKLETLVKSIEIFLDFTIIWALFSSKNIKSTVNNLFFILMGVICFVLFIMLFGYFVDRPDFSVYGTKSILGVQLGGGILGANGSGVLAIYPIILSLNYLNGIKQKVVLFLSLIIILFAQSRTSLIILAILIFIQIICTKKKLSYLVVLSGICLTAYLKWEFIISYFMRGAIQANILSMSGRTVMWKIAKTYIYSKPLTGYGYGAGGYIVSNLNHNMSSLHSGIYEILMGVGYPGFILLVATYMVVLITLIKTVLKKGFYQNRFEIMLIITLTIRTYTSMGIGNWHSFELMMWYYLALSIITINKHGGIANCVQFHDVSTSKV